MKKQDQSDPIAILVYIIAIFLFCVVSPVSAARFDCTKAATHVEKLICSNSEISELDDQVNIDYHKALDEANSEQRSKLINQQKHWLKFMRNRCKDALCINQAYRTQIAGLTAALELSEEKVHTTELKQPNQLIGVWHGSDTASHSIYGKIVIADNTIAWGGKGTSNPYCKTKYSIEKESFGVSFKDQIEGTYVLNENSQFKTYKLKLVPRECLNKLTYLRFTLPFDIPNYADVIEYEENGHISAYISFQKIND